MLSIAKLSPGQERYYERSVAQGLDDYYAGRGESPGIWAGTGSSSLGLVGVLADGHLRVLIDGRDPATRERLRSHVRARTVRVERIDPYSGERRIVQQRLAPVAGYDLVFSVPKSVSLLHALGDPDVRLAVSQAHESAWQAALQYLEDEACVTRRGPQGTIREHAAGFVAAAFQHRTSRAQDPHLHTHVIIANLAQSPDRAWRALDGEPILKTYRLAAGYLYQAQLRGELQRTLGVEWHEPVKGMAEIRGVPREVLAEFSQRRRQVVEALGTEETTSWRAAQLAAIETRDAKEHIDLEQLRGDWRARAAEHGFGDRELRRVLGRARPELITDAEAQATAARLLGPLGLTEKRTTFGDPDVIMALAAARAQGADATTVRALACDFLELPPVERIAEGSTGRSPRYSTAGLVRAERQALAIVARGRDVGAPAADTATVDREISRRSLSDEQAAMVRQAATSIDRVVVVVGAAGAGKTTATAALGRALHADGLHVVGAAPSGAAAEKLRDETGITSMTLHRLLDDSRRDGGLPHRSVVIVDEAGMAETRILAPLLAEVERADGKLVLIGDPHQLPAVGAGGLLEAIAQRVGTIELRENRRQHDTLERHALAAVRSGRGRDWLAYAEREERLVVGPDPLATRSRLLADWWIHAQHDPAGNVMITLRRRDVADLNTLGRLLMEHAGRLGDERLTTGVGVELAPGDRVVCLRNSDGLGVRNGTRGTVEHIDIAARTVSLMTDRGDQVRLSARYLDSGHVRHAYALTGHAGQGATVERAFVLGRDEGQLREWGYVALSRARDTTKLYVVDDVPEPEGHGTEGTRENVVSRLAAALESTAREELAVHAGRPIARGPALGAEIDISARTADRQAALRRIDHERRAILGLRALELDPALRARLAALDEERAEVHLTTSARDEPGLTR
ncbi:MAG TPA: MobF family relaxase [Microbacteriaceae bacterium]|nr:MobF family relaxase [Microbacteriaceae bacterium]